MAYETLHAVNDFYRQGRPVRALGDA